MAANPVLPGMAQPGVDESATEPTHGSAPPLSAELGWLAGQLDAARAALDQERAAGAERDARCQELERAVARERRAAEHEIEYTTSNLVRAHAIAVADRDRAVSQLAEAVVDREAAVRSRGRMEAQRDEAVAQREAAEARRDEALAQRDEACRQRDELQGGLRAAQRELKSERAEAAKRAAAAGPAGGPVAQAGDGLRGRLSLRRGGSTGR